MSDDPASFDAFKWEVRRGLLTDLRHEWQGMGEMANDQRRRAAAAIEELMSEVEAWQKAMQKADRDIAQLRAERDAARRSVCEMSIQLGGVYRRVGGKAVEVTTPEGCAEIMRWDCFKEKP